MFICGLDEAGRGACIGDLIVAGAMIDSTKIDILKGLGVRDSKLLSPGRREAIYQRLIGLVEFRTVVFSPEEIDRYVSRHQLNLMEIEGMANIINSLSPMHVIIDSPSTNTEDVRSKILARSTVPGVTVQVEYKADLNHVIVGAASIIAKVQRDNRINALKQVYGNIGSGYPADPTTKNFLAATRTTRLPIIRYSWNPVKKMSRLP